MAISAEQLNIILTAKDQAFAKAMDQNAKRIAKFAQNANKDLSTTGIGFNKLAGAAAAFVSVSAIQQLFSIVRDTANKLGDLKDAAEAIGLTTDALQELNYAAQLSGVSSDVLQSSLGKLSKNLGDASMGGSAASAAFDKLGLSGSNLSSMSLDAALGQIANKISAIENPAQRAAIATELFGRSGLKMVNMLAQGEKGLQAMAAEARSMGVIIDRDVIANAAEAADKLDAMSMVISSNLSQSLINLGPFLIAAAQNIATLTSAANNFLDAGTSEQNATTDAIRYAADSVGEAKDAYLEYGAAINKVNEIKAEEPYIIIDPKAEMARVRSLELAEKEVEASKLKVVALVAVEKAQAQSEITLQGSIDAIAEKNAETQTEIEMLSMSTEEQIKANAAKEKAATIEKLLAQEMAAKGVVTEDSRLNIEALATQQERLTIALEMGKTAQNDMTAATGRSSGASSKAADAISVYKAQVESLGLTVSEFESISSTIQSSMEDAFMGIVDGTSSAKDAFRTMAVDIIKELYRVLVVQRLVGSFANAGSAGSGILGAIGSAFGVTGNASGGPVQANQPVVTGEHGRELFVPSSAGRILSVPQSKAAVGGGGNVTVMQTINVTTGVQQTVRAEIKSLMPQIADSAKAAVLDAKRRGGSYGSAFA
jgi:hypothetical protein